MEYIKSFIKEIRKDKRKKAICSLILWMLFLVLVFILMGGVNTIPSDISGSSNGNNKQYVSNNSLSNFERMNNYEYTYDINVNINNIDKNYKISGTYYKDTNYFNYNNDNYIIKDNKIYLIDTENSKLINIETINNNELSKIMDFRMLNKKNFSTFLNSSEETTKTSYKDGSSKRTLVYKSSDGKQITFVTSEYSNIIHSIDINYSKYFTNYNNFNVVVELKNINNIDEFNNDYSSYEIVEKGD